MRHLCSVLVLSFVSLSAGCEKAPPDRLEISPNRKIQMVKMGETEDLKVIGYDKKNRPWIDKLEVTWASSDETVAKVDETGKVSATGSGSAEITASAFGLEQKVQAEVVIVGSVEIAQDTPKKLRLLKDKHQLKVVVKDDKGNVIKKPRLTFTASNYCIDVTPSGMVTAQSVGKCAVTVSSKGKEASHYFTVK